MTEVCSSGGRGAVNHYREMNARARVADASPHELVQLMLDGAVASVAGAKGALLAGEIARKAELLTRAIGIVQDGLHASLDERGGELTENLSALYDYIARRLVHANVYNDAQALDEVSSLLRELQQAWRAIAGVLGDSAAAHAAG